MLKNDPEGQERILVGLKKARSHIDKIIQMVEDSEYCVDIMQQCLAVMGLFRSVHRNLMESHLNTCFREAMDTDDDEEKQEKIDEILKVTRLFNR